jgi:DNA-directed RNA polymerase subunit RPC12/RpoP
MAGICADCKGETNDLYNARGFFVCAECAARRVQKARQERQRLDDLVKHGGCVQCRSKRQPVLTHMDSSMLLLRDNGESRTSGAYCDDCLVLIQRHPIIPKN